MLYHCLSSTFCVVVILANLISAKMVPLTQGLFVPAGLLIYPIAFILSDFVTELFGPREARKMIWITLMMNLFALGIIEIALALPSRSAEEEQIFKTIFGTSALRVFSSLAAYIIAQLAAIQLYALIRKWTGKGHLWVRANGSTVVAQLIDTITIDLLFLYWGMGMPFIEVAAVILFSFTYKAFFGALLTPLLYLSHFLKTKMASETDLSTSS